MQNQDGISLALKTLLACQRGVLSAHSFPPVEQACENSLPFAQMPLAARERLGSPPLPFHTP